METSESIEPTPAAILDYASRKSSVPVEEDSKVEVELYHAQPDKRIGWDKTYVVHIDGMLIGFCDSVVEV